GGGSTWGAARRGDTGRARSPATSPGPTPSRPRTWSIPASASCCRPSSGGDRCCWRPPGASAVGDGDGPDLLSRGGGPGGSDIVVEPDALRAAATALARAGAAFHADASGFRARAHLHDHAFGSLPEAAHPHRDYVHAVADAQAA